MNEVELSKHWYGVIRDYCCERNAEPGDSFLLCRNDVLVVGKEASLHIERGDGIWFDSGKLWVKRYAAAIGRKRRDQQVRQAAGEVIAAVSAETELAVSGFDAATTSMPLAYIRSMVPALTSCLHEPLSELVH